jgi:hypothetical protein
MGLLLNLQRGVLPNIYPLKKLIGWFDAVSGFIDNFAATNPTFKAGAYVTGNAYAQQYGFTPPITVVGPGIYECFFAVPLDAVGNFIASVSLANLTVADAVLYDIGVQIVDTTRIRIRCYSLADTAAPTTPIPANHDFFVRVDRLPGF